MDEHLRAQPPLPSTHPAGRVASAVVSPGQPATLWRDEALGSFGDYVRMKIDSRSVYFGMVIVGIVAGGLGIWRRPLSRVFAVCLASFLVFELFCFLVGPEFLIPVWWAVHMPSAIALGADEILQRHGAVVSTAFHLGDIFLWSALITGVLWFRDRRRRREVVAEPCAAPSGGPATQLGNSDIREGPSSVS